MGRALTARLREAGFRPRILSRDPAALALPPGAEAAAWANLPEALDGVHGLVNLAGENLAGRRWTPDFKTRLFQSRMEATERLVEALRLRSSRPEVLVNASAVGFYGTGSGHADESSGPGEGFLAGLCREWEARADCAGELGIRVTRLRLGTVLASRGGALAPLAGIVRAFAGTLLGSGTQGLPWIHLADLADMVLHALQDPAWAGPVNAVARPTSHRDFMETLARVLRRPLWPLPGPLTALGARLGLGEMAQELLLRGPLVEARRAREFGFTWRHPDLEEALRDLLAAPRPGTTPGGRGSPAPGEPPFPPEAEAGDGA